MVNQMGETFSEDQVNAMLETQAIKLRLDSLQTDIQGLTKSVNEHTSSEEREVRAIMKAIEEGANERRKSEELLKSAISEVERNSYAAFVKKTDLKLYAVLIITTVTFTVSIITWIGITSNSYEQNKSATKIIDKVEGIVDTRLGNAN
jgi:hypothetical protein